MTELEIYELDFLKYYQKKFNVAYVKVENNKGILPTKILLYTPNKRMIRHTPTYNGVTVKDMFGWLKPNKIYSINELLKEKGR